MSSFRNVSILNISEKDKSFGMEILFIVMTVSPIIILSVKSKHYTLKMISKGFMCSNYSEM